MLWLRNQKNNFQFAVLSRGPIANAICHLIGLNEKIVTGPEVIKLVSCSTQLSMKCIILINVKMPTIACPLTFTSMINTTPESLKARKVLIL